MSTSRLDEITPLGNSLASIPSFQPHPWFPGGWLQTLSIKLIRPGLSLDARPDVTTIRLSDPHRPPDQLFGYHFPGDTIPTSNGASKKPLVVVLHGMGGNALSGYMRSMASSLNQAGYDALLWNHRGAGVSADSCRQLHHPGHTDDIRLLSQYLVDHRPRWTKNGLACIAFSLGSNVLLKYLAEEQRDSLIDVGICISPPLDMETTSIRLRSGANRVFDRYLLRKQKQELLRENVKHSASERKAIESAGSVWELDDRFTSKHLGYRNASEFYQDNSAVHCIDCITRPTLLLHAEDDPVVDPEVFCGTEWESHPQLHPVVLPSGGHTGFLEKTGTRWHERASVSFLDSYDCSEQCGA